MYNLHNVFHAAFSQLIWVDYKYKHNMRCHRRCSTVGIRDNDERYPRKVVIKPNVKRDAFTWHKFTNLPICSIFRPCLTRTWQYVIKQEKLMKTWSILKTDVIFDLFDRKIPRIPIFSMFWPCLTRKLQYVLLLHE